MTDARAAPASRLLADSFVVAHAGTTVLTSARLSLDAGVSHVVCGRNGAGKSSLLHAIMERRGLVSGLLMLDGQRHVQWTRRTLHEAGVWWWPQRGLLSPALTVGQHAQLVAEDGERQLADALAAVGAAATLGAAHASALSPGERRLVEAALMLVAMPRIVLADEPLAGVSPVQAEAIGRCLSELRTRGAAVAWTTHDWWAAEAFGDVVTWVVSRTTRGLGTPADAARDHQFSREYLGAAGKGKSA